MLLWKKKRGKGNRGRETDGPFGLVAEVDELDLVGDLLLLQREQHPLRERACKQQVPVPSKPNQTRISESS